MPNKKPNIKFGFRPCSHGTGQIYALRSHQTHETGRIRAQLTGRICDLLKLGLAFYGIGLKFLPTHVNSGPVFFLSNLRGRELE